MYKGQKHGQKTTAEEPLAPHQGPLLLVHASVMQLTNQELLTKISVECKEVWRFVRFVCFESIGGGEDSRSRRFYFDYVSSVPA